MRQQAVYNLFEFYYDNKFAFYSNYKLHEREIYYKHHESILIGEQLLLWICYHNAIYCSDMEICIPDFSKISW